MSLPNVYCELLRQKVFLLKAKNGYLTPSACQKRRGPVSFIRSRLNCERRIILTAFLNSDVLIEKLPVSTHKHQKAPVEASSANCSHHGEPLSC